MMKVTVRTLDSKNTTFDIDENETVIQFKEKVAPVLAIPVERQRIIFKGKVLHDEKLMKDYNVDGCVVHLVQRAPPSSSETPSTESQPNNDSTQRNSNERQSNVFIGAFQGANDMSNVTQQLVENLLSTFGGASGGATVTTSSMNSAQNDAQQRLQQAQSFFASGRTRLQNLEVNADPEPSMEVDEETSASQTSQETDRQQSGNTASLASTPESLANVIKDFQALYVQLEPSLTRYQSLLSNPQSEDRTVSDDSLPDGIAEIFHSLSHGLHALSDVTFNFLSPQPQTLSCLPRMSPVSMPPHVHVRPSAFVAQGSTNAAPTSTSSASAQPHFHVHPHPHVHVPSRPDEPTNQGQAGQQNNGMGARPSGHAHDFAFHRPIGVSATVIQIPRMPAFNMQTAPSGTVPTPASVPPVTNTAGASSFSFPNIFSSLQQSMATGIPQTHMPASGPGFSFSSSNASGPQPTNAAPSTSSTQPGVAPQSSGQPRAPQPSAGLPFSFNPLSQPGLAGHPDPMVPCQSFHFGPRFQQSGDGNVHGSPQIVAEVSSVVIEHIHTGAQSQASSEARSSTNPTPQRPDDSSVPTSGQGATPYSMPNMQLPFDQGFVSNMLSGIFAQQHQQQHQQQSQPTGPQTSQPQTQHQQSENAADDDDDEDAIDVNDAARIYQEVQRAVVNALSGTGESQTIRGLVETTLNDIGTAGTNAEEPTDLPSRLVSFVAEHMTVTDIFQLALGSSNEPVVRMGPHLLRFLETNFNAGQPITRDNIPGIVEKILQGMQSTQDNLNSLSIRPEVDLPATVRQIDAEFCEEGILLLLNQASSSFAEDLTSFMKRYISVVVAVHDHCIAGGFEASLRSYISSEGVTRMLNSVDPPLREMFTNVMISKMRNAAQSSPPLSAEDIQRRLVLKTQSTRKRDETVVKIPVVANGATEKGDEEIDVKKRWEEMNGASKEEDDDEYQISSEYQEWHRHVPPEWIAVITRDAKRQRSQPPQRPFSDAYYSCLPPKRRKAAGKDQSAQNGIDFSSALQNSIAAANVEPNTSQSDLSKDLDQQELAEAFQDSFRSDARKRLEKDDDYRPRRFPKSQDYYFGE